MAWTTPRTWVVGEVVTSALMNAHVRDNLGYLHGDAGAVTIVNALFFGTPSQMRGHRHPYGNERHIESGYGASSPGNDGGGHINAVSFTSAFAAAPNVTLVGDTSTNRANTAQVYAVYSVTTTGFNEFSFQNSGGTQTMEWWWIAEGA